jgi:hypothetical protein
MLKEMWEDAKREAQAKSTKKKEVPAQTKDGSVMAILKSPWIFRNEIYLLNKLRGKEAGPRPPVPMLLITIVGWTIIIAVLYMRYAK